MIYCMVVLSQTLETFTAEQWESAFAAYVKANKSHWKPAPFSAIRGQLKDKGSFEFGFPSMGTWTCKLRLQVTNGAVEAIFVKNSDLTGRMQKHLEQMEEVFLAEFR